MKVHDATTGSEAIASYRYRIGTPSKLLTAKGIKTSVGLKVDREANTVVFSKHWTYKDASYSLFCRLRGQRIIFEIATDAEKAGVKYFFDKEHKCSPEDFRSKSGPKKFGQELVRSKLPEGRLRGKFKERFAYIYDQITKLGGYDGIVFVVDEFRSWQDRHPAGTPAYAEDEEVLETLAFVLPTQHLNIVTIIASQGDMPQKLSRGGEGDRFLPLYLLADKNKGDFGEIVTFRCRELLKGAGTDIKDYYDHCRKEYKFIKQANISLDYFTAIFPFQPRCFDVLRPSPKATFSTTCLQFGQAFAWLGKPSYGISIYASCTPLKFLREV